MGMNLLVYAICVLAFWVIGFALQMGGVGRSPALVMTRHLAENFKLLVSMRY
jgi:hypothetical protein